MTDERILARFWALVDRSGDCWLWLGVKPKGYGLFTLSKRVKVSAHIFAYRVLVGPIPDGLELDHKCRNRACVNPAHLEPVTHSVNVSRSYEARWGKDTCKQGHPLVAGNVYVSNGKRTCKRCANERTARNYRRNHAERAA